MKLPALAAASFVLAASGAFAQGIVWQENAGPTFNNGVFSGPGGGITAVKVTPAFAIAIGGIEVFTGESPGTGTVSVYGHDPVLEQPQGLLAQRTFTVVAANQFQGGSFANAVQVAAGQTVWIAWSLPFVAQSPVDEPKQTLGQFYRTSLDGGQSWFGPFQFNNNHFKFRLRGPVNPCSGYTTAVGAGCGGTGGSGGAPRLYGGGCPAAGDAVQLSIENAAPSAAALLTFGTGTATAPIVPTCLAINLPLLAGTLPIPIDVQGKAVMFGTLPAVPAGDVWLQVLMADATAPSGVAATNALRLTIG